MNISDVDATGRAVRFQSIVHTSVVIVLVVVVIVTVVKVTGRSVVVATERTAATDVDEAVGAVETSTRTLAEFVIVATPANDAPWTHAATKNDRHQPAAPSRRPAAAFSGQPPTSPGQGELAQEAGQSAAAAQKHGVQVNRSLGVALGVEVAGDADPRPMDVGLEDHAEEEQDIDDGQDNDGDQRRGGGRRQTA